jgi:hypothetical protein
LTAVKRLGGGSNHREVLSAQQIVGALADAGVIEDSRDYSIQPSAAGSSQRRKFPRFRYQLWRGGKCRAQIYVAKDLTEFHARAQQFQAACPTIAVKPLFLVRCEGQDIVGLEFAGEKNLQEAFSGALITQDQFLEHLSAVHSALAATTESSSVEAASLELDELFRLLHQTQLLSDTDLAVLDSLVAPRLRSALLSPKPTTRWTNGDFLPQNIVLTATGSKLIDYEFATRTHFFCEDPARLRLHSAALPVSVLEWTDEVLGAQREGAEIYSLLRQLILEWQIKTIPGLHIEMANIARLLIPRLDRWRLGSTPSLLIPAAGNEGILGNGQAAVQVFFSPEFAFNEFRSIHTSIPEGVWSRIELPLPIGQGSWNIRIDPIDRSGIVEISSVEVRNSRHQTVPIPLTELAPGGSCVTTSSAPCLTLIGHGIDPQVTLPVFTTEDPGPIWLVAWMRWERLETGLGRVLEAFAAQNAASPKVNNRLVDEMQTNLEQVNRQLQQSESQAKAEHETLLAMSEEDKRLRTALEAALQVERDARVVAQSELAGSRTNLVEERQARNEAESATQNARRLLDEERAARHEIDSLVLKERTLRAEMAVEREKLAAELKSLTASASAAETGREVAEVALRDISAVLESERALKAEAQAESTTTKVALDQERAIRSAIQSAMHTERSQYKLETERLRTQGMERQKEHDQGLIQTASKLHQMELSLREAVLRHQKAASDVENLSRQLTREEQLHRETRNHFEHLLQSERHGRADAEHLLLQSETTLRHFEASFRSTEAALIQKDHSFRECEAALQDALGARAESKLQRTEIEVKNSRETTEIRSQFQEKLLERQEALRVLEHSLQAAQQRIAELEGSASWKLTLPVRRAIGLIKPGRKSGTL